MRATGFSRPDHPSAQPRMNDARWLVEQFDCGLPNSPESAQSRHGRALRDASARPASSGYHRGGLLKPSVDHDSLVSATGMMHAPRTRSNPAPSKMPTQRARA